MFRRTIPRRQFYGWARTAEGWTMAASGPSTQVVYDQLRQRGHDVDEARVLRAGVRPGDVIPVVRSEYQS